LNPNYVAIVKQNTNKLFVAGFIKPIEEATWLSSINFDPKKYGKLKIHVDFKKLNATIKKNPYPNPFTDEVINIVAEHEVYTFLGKLSRYQ
jgi:hypothetical protein